MFLKKVKKDRKKVVFKKKVKEVVWRSHDLTKDRKIKPKLLVLGVHNVVPSLGRHVEMFTKKWILMLKHLFLKRAFFDELFFQKFHF